MQMCSFLLDVLSCSNYSSREKKKKEREGRKEGKERTAGERKSGSSRPLDSTCQTQEVPVGAQTAAPPPASGLIEP